MNITLCELKLETEQKIEEVSPNSKFIQNRAATMLNKAGIDMKILMTILFMLTVSVSLSGCNTIERRNTIETACEQGIKSLNQHLSDRTHKVHQANLSRANSLFVAAQVQQQFAEYPGCVEKVKRAQDYLSGQQTAIISRL